MSWNTPPSWSAGQTSGVSAGLTVLSNNDAVIGSAWTADARTSSTIWTASTSPTLGNGSLTARYRNTGKTWDFDLEIVAGSTTTFGSGQWIIVLPFTFKTTRAAPIAIGGCIDNSTGNRYPVLATFSGTNLNMQVISASAPTSQLNGTTPFTWATNDALSIHLAGIEAA